MRHRNSFIEEVQDMENIMSVCGGTPRGDELPQVAGIEDIIADVYSDAFRIPHEYALGAFRHQYDDDFDYEQLVH